MTFSNVDKKGSCRSACILYLKYIWKKVFCILYLNRAKKYLLQPCGWCSELVCVWNLRCRCATCASCDFSESVMSKVCTNVYICLNIVTAEAYAVAYISTVWVDLIDLLLPFRLRLWHYCYWQSVDAITLQIGLLWNSADLCRNGWLKYKVLYCIFCIVFDFCKSPSLNTVATRKFQHSKISSFQRLTNSWVR